MDSWIIQLVNEYKSVPESMRAYSSLDAYDSRIYDLKREVDRIGLRPEIMRISAKDLNQPKALSAAGIVKHTSGLSSNIARLPTMLSRMHRTFDTVAAIRSSITDINAVLGIPERARALYAASFGADPADPDDDTVQQLFAALADGTAIADRLTELIEGRPEPSEVVRQRDFIKHFRAELDAVGDQCVSAIEALLGSTHDPLRVIASISRLRQLRPTTDAQSEAAVLLGCRRDSLRETLQQLRRKASHHKITRAAFVTEAVSALRETLTTTALQAEILFCPTLASEHKTYPARVATPAMAMTSAWTRGVTRMFRAEFTAALRDVPADVAESMRQMAGRAVSDAVGPLGELGLGFSVGLLVG
ncbi:hypothetical protein J8273_4516 [Carpediemonas membranifera]|uniref:Uncharacterized protein n=1 Tax=Carpediemonas membranifera TaxID=201153 RepID=A0A8J6AT69_9EUKA|nr:hypothetical protein J8273_4516 [Carpediemonas membranifera]|eukprot:KAG9393916.1 hypothetical protein J8273_4516 [Carpediemonas membranifera]